MSSNEKMSFIISPHNYLMLSHYILHSISLSLSLSLSVYLEVKILSVQLGFGNRFSEDDGSGNDDVRKLETKF